MPSILVRDPTAIADCSVVVVYAWFQFNSASGRWLFCVGDQCLASDCSLSSKYFPDSKIGQYCSDDDCDENTEECCNDRDPRILRIAKFSKENLQSFRDSAKSR